MGEFGHAKPSDLMGAAELLVGMVAKLPALRAELLVIFGAIDRGEAVAIAGIADDGLRAQLRAVFTTLRLAEREADSTGAGGGFCLPSGCSATSFAPTFGMLLKAPADAAPAPAPVPAPVPVPVPAPPVRKRSIGPSMPPSNWKAPAPSNDGASDSDSDDAVVGPMLPHLARKPTAASLKDEAAALVAIKAQQDNEWRRLKGLPPNPVASASSSSASASADPAGKGQKRQRDSWMTQLPTGRTDKDALARGAAEGVYKTKTKFSRRKTESAEADSSWTMAPEEARKRERAAAAAELLGLELEPEGGNRGGAIGPSMRPGGRGKASASLGMAPRNEQADAAARAAIDAFNARNRPKTLVEAHQAKQAKKGLKRGIGSWDRDTAMAFGQSKAKGRNQVDGAVRDASELYNRFAGATQSRTFL
jgi:hypothetical protein